MSEKPSLHFETPQFSYDELEARLRDFQPDSDRFSHDVPSIISVQEGIRAGRMGAPELKEISRQVWLSSIGPSVQKFLDRY